MPLKVWSSGEVLTAGDLNGNFDLCVRTDAAKTIAATHTWSAAQNFAAGTVAAPGIYLNGDSDTGLYHIAADRLGLAVAGAKVVEWSAGAVAITGTLDVSGAVALASTLAVTGAATLSSLLTVDTGAAGEHLRVGPQSGDPLSAVTTIATIYGDTGVNGAGPRLALNAGSGGAGIAVERQNNGADLDMVLSLRRGGNQFVEALRLVGSSLQATFAGSLAWGGGAAIASSDDVFAGTVLEATYTFASGTGIDEGTAHTFTVTVTGAQPGDHVVLSLDIGSAPGLSFLTASAYVSANNTVTVTLFNGSGRGTVFIIAGGKIHVAVIQPT